MTKTHLHCILDKKGQQWLWLTEPVAQEARRSLKLINFEIWGKRLILLLSVCHWGKGEVLCVSAVAPLACVSGYLL